MHMVPNHTFAREATKNQNEAKHPFLPLRTTTAKIDLLQTYPLGQNQRQLLPTKLPIATPQSSTPKWCATTIRQCRCRYILHTTVAPGCKRSVQSSLGLRTPDIAGASAVVGTAGAAAVAGMPAETTRYRTVTHARKDTTGGASQDQSTYMCFSDGGYSPVSRPQQPGLKNNRRNQGIKTSEPTYRVLHPHTRKTQLG